MLQNNPIASTNKLQGKQKQKKRGNLQIKSHLEDLSTNHNVWTLFWILIPINYYRNSKMYGTMGNLNIDWLFVYINFCFSKFKRVPYLLQTYTEKFTDEMTYIEFA